MHCPNKTLPHLQAGFDGPYLIELTMLRLLVTIYQVSDRGGEGDK